jgi:maleate isomerase
VAARVISVGILTPHAAAGPEEEFPAVAPGRIMTRVARISTKDAGTAPASPLGLRMLMTAPLLDNAAELLARGPIDVVGYASTSSAYAVGYDEETAMVSGLSRQMRVPVVATCASAVLALRLLGVERIALVHPPWFDNELNELGASYFGSQGFEVVASTSASLPPDPRRIQPSGVFEWTSRHVPDDAEAVFIGGNGFRAASAIEPLEFAIGRPVLESNQVLLWSLLAQAGVTFGIRGYGQLFAQEPRPATRRHSSRRS